MCWWVEAGAWGAGRCRRACRGGGGAALRRRSGGGRCEAGLCCTGGGLILGALPAAQVGTIVPLMVVYRIEWSLKRSWARAAGFQVPPDPPVTLGICLGVLALLTLLTLAASQLLLLLPLYDLSRCTHDQ
jgi:hypothetical protein